METNDIAKLADTLYSGNYCNTEWVSVEYFRRLFELSPFTMCKVLNDRKFGSSNGRIARIETDHEEASQGKSDYFTIEILDSVRIHISTWRACLDNYGYEYFIPLDINPNTTSNAFEEQFATPVQQPPTAALESTTPVNAARWEASCRAACELLVKIMENSQAIGIIKRDFLDMLGKQYSGSGTVHTKVEEIAWAALPASKKNGAGCPKKNSENS